MNQVKLIDDKHHFFSIFITMLALPCSLQALPRTDPPIHPGHPFLFMWNAPTELCDIRFGMPLDLSYFHFVSSTLKTATDQSISIFYTDRFGIFPYVDEDTGEMYDEGLPQLIDLQEHHDLAKQDIEYYIPDDQQGLAVLDFEEWRPQWVRNWGSKDIYRQISIETVKKRNVSLSDDEAEERAKIVFERAAKRYFLRSIRTGKKLRPNRLWGYYLYPDCYNYDYNQDMAGYTGECPAIENNRNDELLWLWTESTALYPSIYLELVLRDSQQAKLFVRHRIQEAIRVSMLPNSSYSIPIYAYIRPVYKDSIDDYMSEFDLVNTIGEAAALGAAGVVSWGDMNVTDTEDSCLDARHHLERVMNPYILNVSTATQLCSEALCQRQGRCVRKHWEEDVYLHLDPMRYRIQQQRRGGPLTVSGSLSQDDINWFDRNFDCMCYSEEPCRSVLTVNAINEAFITTRDQAADRPRPLLAVIMLLCLKSAVM
ncbi:hyaluronidase PH-20-like [Morone saxatilis]|uniref:hyaluronidase PH-20-like n=1 Tax=Morone saxatilis TaxID=34816 RepID=UPI0015E1C0A4|nr:hyaluronidase PH-20-like [Morone saxatilis]